jgi:hypothetical protein
MHYGELILITGALLTGGLVAASVAARLLAASGALYRWCRPRFR